MKKNNLLTSFMLASTCVMPILTSLTSCSTTNISEEALQIKDTTIQIFMNLCKNARRNVWNGQDGFDFIVSAMNTFGYRQSAGRDYWSYIPEVAEKIEKETGISQSARNFPNYGNIWYDLPASEGMEDAPKVILQAHMDSQMTFADESAKQNWLANGINATYERDDDIIYTNGKTSLGADGGIGISLLLSIAKHTNIFKHGGIRLLFTAGESEATDHYSSSASFLWNDQYNDGKQYWPGCVDNQQYIYSNIKKPFGDTENEFSKIISISGLYNKTIYRSVAGISEVCFSDKQLNLKDNTNKLDGNGKNLYTITIDNLHGGKSSKDINSGYANALEMMVKTLANTKQMQLISASSLPGAYNIAKTATATFISSNSLDELNAKKTEILNKTKAVYKAENWNNVKFEIAKNNGEIGKGQYAYGLTVEQSKNLVDYFAESSWGAVDWFDQQHKNVKESHNHGGLTLSVNQNNNENNNFSNLTFYSILRTNDTNKINGYRNSVQNNLSSKISCLYSGGNPGMSVIEHVSGVINDPWEGSEKNKLIDLIAEGYKNINITPKIVDNHGWVEAGCFPNIYSQISPNMEIACLGIEVNNSQELTESVYTDSLNTLNKALLYTLMNIKKSI